MDPQRRAEAERPSLDGWEMEPAGCFSKERVNAALHVSQSAGIWGIWKVGGQQWHRCRNAIKRQLAQYRSEPPRNSPISSGNCLTIKFGLSHSYFAVAPVSWASARRCPPALHSGRALGEPPRPEPALKQEASRARNAAGRPAPPPGHDRRQPAFQARGPLLQWQTQPRATAGAQCPPQVQSTIKSTHSAERTRPGRYIPTGHPAPTRRNLSPHAKCGRGNFAMTPASR